MKGVMRNSVAKATPRVAAGLILWGIEEGLKGYGLG